jgi:D-glycero-D-manno-heptose 1,7-bisphosphate phosphatase
MIRFSFWLISKVIAVAIPPLNIMKILFLDLDGTVRKTKSGATFINDPCDQELIPGVEDAIEKYADWVVVGVTNQGGVGAGFKSYDDCISEQHKTLSLLPLMERIYFCPDSKGEECWLVTREDNDRLIDSIGRDYRKPGTGMIDRALFYLKESPTEILMVGDRPEDEQCAKNANIPFMWAHDWRTNPPIP